MSELRIFQWVMDDDIAYTVTATYYKRGGHWHCIADAEPVTLAATLYKLADPAFQDKLEAEAFNRFHKKAKQ